MPLRDGLGRDERRRVVTAAGMKTAFPARLERFGMVDSTQTIVRRWLDAGTPEVAVAVADQQAAGRGRLDRTWVAPPGVALLCSMGFRPRGLDAGHAWRLGAIVSLAMLDAAEDVAGLREGRLRLKWPNDIVIDAATPGDPGGLLLRKAAGVLGESVLAADGTIETAVVGIGINADWVAADFPADLAAAMTSLREVSGGRPIDRDQLLDAFLARLEPRYEAIRAGHFDAGAWTTRQVTTGHDVEVATGDRRLRGRATGVDPESGSLVVEVEGREWSVGSGEVTHCRVLG